MRNPFAFRTRHPDPLKDPEGGASAIEYGLLALIIAVAAIGLIQSLQSDKPSTSKTSVAHSSNK